MSDIKQETPNMPHGTELIPCVIRAGQLWRAEINYHAGDPIQVSQATIDLHPWVFEKVADRDRRLKTTRVTVLSLDPSRAQACGLVPAGDGIERYEVVRLDPGIERRDVIERELASKTATAASIEVSVKLLDHPEFVDWKAKAEEAIRTAKGEIDQLKQDNEKTRGALAASASAARRLNGALGAEEGKPLDLGTAASRVVDELVRLRGVLDALRDTQVVAESGKPGTGAESPPASGLPAPGAGAPAAPVGPSGAAAAGSKKNAGQGQGNRT